MPDKNSADNTVEKTIRLDKWLKLSRLCKTRTIAGRTCEEGKVKVNGTKSKPSHIIRIGDQITIKARAKYRTVDVLDIVYKSISNQNAKNLYNEHTQKLTDESKELNDFLQQMDKDGKRKYKGRPTKKERREIDKIKDVWN